MKKLLYFCLCAGLFFISNVISIEAATYEYDELGRVTQVTGEDGSSVTYVYDANGNIVEIRTETGKKEDNSVGTSSGGSTPVIDVVSGENTDDVENRNDENISANQIGGNGTSSSEAGGDAVVTPHDKDGYTLSGMEDNTGKWSIGIILAGAAVIIGGAGIFLLAKRKKKDNSEEVKES